MKSIDNFMREINGIVSKNSATGYRSDLHSFENFLMIRLSLSQEELNENEENILTSLTETDIYAYISYIQISVGNSAFSINRKISALKKYYSYLKKQHIVKQNVAAEIKTIPTNAKHREVLTIEECNQLLASISGENILRDKLILGFILVGGIKVSELLRLKIHNSANSYITVNINTETERIVYLNEALKSILKDYLLLVHVSNPNILFVNNSGESALNIRTFHQILQKYFKASGLYQKGVTSETLRRTCKYLLKEFCNMDSYDIDIYLGKKSGKEYYTPVNVNITLLDKIPIDFGVKE